MRRSLFCFLLTLCAVFWVSAATALPIRIAQQPVPSSEQISPRSSELEPFFDYINNQKYTLWLGDYGRGACGYYIDPTDVYQQGGNRFTTAKVTRGMGGTACENFFDFDVLQANCQDNTLYRYRFEEERLEEPTVSELVREYVEERLGELPQRVWQRQQLELSDFSLGTGASGIITQQSAARVCALSAKSAS